jgi:putative hydrolase of the HAD superfamily
MHIFFDVDGVLLKGFPDFLEARRWEKDLGIEQGLSKHFFGLHWIDILKGKKDLKETLRECLPAIGFKGEPEQIIDAWFQCDSFINNELMQYIPKLKFQENLKLYIATDQEHNRAKYLWENLGFRDTFDGIYYSAQLGARKKNPIFFQKINEELKLSDETVVFFDDCHENIKTACMQGWEGYHYQKLSDFLENKHIEKLLG